MDYITEEINRYLDNQEFLDKMHEAGFDDYFEYIDYLADLEEEARISYWEAKQELGEI